MMSMTGRAFRRGPAWARALVGWSHHPAPSFPKPRLTLKFSRPSRGFAFAIPAVAIISCPTGALMKTVYFLAALALGPVPALAAEDADDKTPQIVMPGESATLEEFR